MINTPEVGSRVMYLNARTQQPVVGVVKSINDTLSDGTVIITIRCTIVKPTHETSSNDTALVSTSDNIIVQVALAALQPA
jgi:hypothetical protein